MSRLFLTLYHYFKERKLLLVILLLGFLGLATFLALGLEFEEDISKIMPVDEKVAELNRVFDNSEFSDRLVVNVTYADSTIQPENPDELIAFCEALVDTLQQSLDSTYIREINYKIDESQFLDLYTTLYQNLPLFLDSADYKKISELIEPAEVEQRVKGAYRALLSPAGFALRESVLRDPLGFTRLAFDKLQSFQIDENYEIYQGYIITRDYRNLIFFVSPAQSARETLINKEMLRTLDGVSEGVMAQFNGEVQAEYFGAVAVAVDNATRIRKDVTATVTVALTVLLILIGLFFRRVYIFFLLVVPVIFGALTALSILYLFKGEVSIISIGIGSVLLGITLDYSLHVFTHYRSTLNVPKVIKDLALPIFMSSLTTASAFLCLYLIRSEALHDLGLFAALSVIVTALFALFILPFFLKQKKAEDSPKQHRANILDKMAAYPLDRNRWVLAFIIVVSIVCAFTASDYEFEDDLNKVNYMSDKVRAAEARLNSITSATMRGVYLIASGETLEEALVNNEQIIPIADSLKEQGLIKEYTSASKLLLSTGRQEEKIARWNDFWTEEKKQALKTSVSETAQALKFKENTFNGFYNLLDSNFESQAPSEFTSLINAFLKDYISQREGLVSVLTLLRLEQENKPPVYDTFRNVPQVNILDKEYMVSQFVDILRVDFDLLVKISLLLVLILLHVAYGRAELAFIAFIPILLSWLWTLGLMSLFGLKFNIINIIITTFIFGLGIDYSIFVMRGLMQEHKFGEQNLPSYKTSILLSALTTVTGIGVLIFAQHPALKSIAGLALIGILSVLLITFTVEPLMFRWLIFDKNGNRREYPRTIINTLKTLYVYGILGLGSIVVSILGLVVFAFVFIPVEKRKYAVHWMIWAFSKLYLRISFPFHKKVLNPHQEDFSRPAVVISNHQSHIDTPNMFALTPKLIILTKAWVYNFPFYRLICWMADFFPVTTGIDDLLPKLKERIDNGYQIAIFPEGSRSKTEKVRRFHKGAFYIAEQLNLDIVPVYLHGTGRFLRKGSFWGKSNDLTVKIGQRIPSDDPRFSTNYARRTKEICHFYRQEYAQLKAECETPFYYRRHLLENFLYKGPVLEWYTRIKIRLEQFYEPFDNLIPKQATITDIGCGYGYLAYLLHFRSADRRIIGIDYDKQKIKTARNCAANNDRISFFHADAVNYELTPSDAFILKDVLHYLKPEEQWQLLEKCLHKLNEGGQLIIRDGDRDLSSRHQKTKWTEIYSTQTGFNKKRNKLYYLSGTELTAWAKRHNLEVIRIDNTKRTSNIIFVLRK